MCRCEVDVHTRVIEPVDPGSTGRGITVDGTNVVGFAVIVPCEDFDHVESLLQDLVPAVENKRATREDPVLINRLDT